MELEKKVRDAFGCVKASEGLKESRGRPAGTDRPIEGRHYAWPQSARRWLYFWASAALRSWGLPWPM